MKSIVSVAIAVLVGLLAPGEAEAYACQVPVGSLDAPVKHVYPGSACSAQWYSSPLPGKSACYYLISRDTGGSAPGILDRRSWLAENEARRFPFYRPFTDASVKVISGWLYGYDRDTCGCSKEVKPVCDSQNVTHLNACRAACAGAEVVEDGECKTGDWAPTVRTHGAIDYAKHDSSGRQITFPVHSPADGTVLAAAYNQSGGNIIVIEHVDPNDPEFAIRTVYHHMMNGIDRDIDEALKTTLTGDDAEKYLAEANEARICLDAIRSGAKPPSGCTLEAVERKWGTSKTIMLVKPGDKIVAGQQIGWAGDTGVHSGGIHLHFVAARLARHVITDFRDPSEPLITVDRWTRFDPTGFYGGPIEKPTCYNAASQSCFAVPGIYPNGNQHCTTFAPVFQDFAGLPYAAISGVEAYFANTGYYPRLLAADTNNNTLEVSGSFSYETDPPVVRHLRSFSEVQSDFNSLIISGYWPIQRSATETSGGTRFTTIYGRTAQNMIARTQMTSPYFQQLFAEYYEQGFVLVDQEPFLENNTVYWTGLWVEASGVVGQFRYFDKTLSEIWNLDANYRAAGYQLVSLARYHNPQVSSDRYAGLWHKSNWTTQVVSNVSHANFRSQRDHFAKYGYQIHSLQAHDGLYQIVFR